jgi:hypothetical protein
MAEQPQGFARRMMAQKLMADARATPNSDSPSFFGRIRPSVQDMADPTRFSDMAGPAYTTGATASLFAPGAGVVDIFGGAPDPMRPGEMLPSFGQNVTQGNYLDAGLQALGGAGDVMMAAGAVIPPALPAATMLGTALKAPRAARVAGQAADAAKIDPNQAAGAAMDAAQARYFETGQFEPPTAENPVSVVLPTETEPGIIAFHGSGADFDEFRLEMIGTGEGAQAYGYGLYFTDSEDIAKFYRNSVGGANVLKTAQNIKIEVPSGGTETAANFTGFRNKFAEFYGEDAALFADRYLGQFTIDPDAPQDVLIERAKVLMANVKESDRIPENAEEIVSKITLPERGKIYKVALQPKPDELLDYDLPFAEQSKDIQEKLLQAGYEVDPRTSGSGGMILEAIMSNVGREGAHLELGGKMGHARQVASQRLADAGIPGIKYFSGNSRTTAGGELIDVSKGNDGFRAKVAVENRSIGGKGRVITTSPPYKTEQEALDWAEEATKRAERNYVIFDNKAVKILEKYGIAGPVLVTGAVVGASKAGNDNEDGGSILPDAGVL